MNKKEIQKKYKEKIKLFNKLNKFYYDKSEPVASDQEYDILKKEILSLETKNKFLKSNNSPSNTVGYKPSKNFKKEFFPSISFNTLPGNLFEDILA